MSRNRASARDAGAKLERVVATYLADHLGDDRIERRVRNGTKDRGDVGGVRTAHGRRLVIECKSAATVNLPGWIREAEVEAGNDDAVAGVVVFKRRGVGLDDDANVGEQLVAMRLSDLVALLSGARPVHADHPEDPT